MDILKRIEDLRIQKGWSVYKLCNEADLSPSALSNMYARNTYPSIPTILKICEVLNISISEFFSDEDTDGEFTAKEREMIYSFRKLNANEKDAFETLLNALSKNK